MKMKNIVFFIICFYFLTLLQSSFFPHFPFGHWLNLVLIAVVLINLFTPHHSWWGVISAFFGGFFLDIFSEKFFGFWVLLLLAASILIKFILKKYVRFPVFRRS